MKEYKATICTDDLDNICPDCSHKGLHGKGSVLMLPDEDLWSLTLYCDKCDVEIEQIYQAIFIKSIVYKENEDEG